MIPPLRDKQLGALRAVTGATGGLRISAYPSVVPLLVGMELVGGAAGAGGAASGAAGLVSDRLGPGNSEGLRNGRRMSEPRIPAAAYTPGRGDPVPRHRRNTRRAYDREGRKIQPMDLANAIGNGAMAIRAVCPPPCRHEGELPIDRFPLEMAVGDVGLHLRCSACGRKGPETVPV